MADQTPPGNAWMTSGRYRAGKTPNMEMIKFSCSGNRMTRKTCTEISRTSRTRMILGTKNTGCRPCCVIWNGTVRSWILFSCGDQWHEKLWFDKAIGVRHCKAHKISFNWSFTFAPMRRDHPGGGSWLSDFVIFAWVDWPPPSCPELWRPAPSSAARPGRRAAGSRTVGAGPNGRTGACSGARACCPWQATHGAPGKP